MGDEIEPWKLETFHKSFMKSWDFYGKFHQLNSMGLIYNKYLHLPLGLSTLDSICDLLTIAFRGVSHCPPSGLYAYLCRLLALCLGHRDPYATACLVTESVSITCRHQLLTHLHRQLR